MDMDGNLGSGINLLPKRIKNRDILFRFKISELLDWRSFTSVNQEMNVRIWKNAWIISQFPQMVSLFREENIIDRWTKDVDRNCGLKLLIRWKRYWFTRLALQRLSQYERKMKWIRFELRLPKNDVFSLLYNRAVITG